MLCMVKTKTVNVNSVKQCIYNGVLCSCINLKELCSASSIPAVGYLAILGLTMVILNCACQSSHIHTALRTLG